MTGAVVGHRRADEFTSTLLTLAGLSAIASLAWYHMAITGDGFWYIATGRLILEHHGLPPEDPFCFATVKQAWTLVSAGSQVLFAVVADRLGLRALMILSTLVELLAVGWLWLASSRGRGFRLVLLPLALLFVQLDAEDLSARGQIFGDLGFVWLLLAMQRLRHGQAIHWLQPLIVGALWVNLHLSFLLAIAVPGLFVGALLLESRKDRPLLPPFVRFSLLVLAGSLLNPYGYRYWIHAVRCALDPVAGTFDLFQSPDLQAPLWMLAPALALAILVARNAILPRAGASADTAILLVFLCAAVCSRRYVTQLLAVEMLMLTPLLKELLAPMRLGRARAIGIHLGSSFLLLVATWWGFRDPKDPLQHVPAQAAELVRHQALPDNVMNPYHWGGYLAYAWRGHPKYFIDGRDIFGLVANGILEDSASLRAGAPDWQRILDAYEINTVLWERGAPLDYYLAHSAAWQEAHRDQLAVVYVRRK